MTAFAVHDHEGLGALGDADGEAGKLVVKDGILSGRTRLELLDGEVGEMHGLVSFSRINPMRMGVFLCSSLFAVYQIKYYFSIV